MGLLEDAPFRGSGKEELEIPLNVHLALPSVPASHEQDRQKECGSAPCPVHFLALRRMAQ